MTSFVAFAVDINGTALARYDLAATEMEAAEKEAQQFLEQHPVIEVWSDDHWRVADREDVTPNPINAEGHPDIDHDPG